MIASNYLLHNINDSKGFLSIKWPKLALPSSLTFWAWNNKYQLNMVLDVMSHQTPWWLYSKIIEWIAVCFFFLVAKGNAVRDLYVLKGKHYTIQHAHKSNQVWCSVKLPSLLSVNFLPWSSTFQMESKNMSSFWKIQAVAHKLKSSTYRF